MDKVKFIKDIFGEEKPEYIKNVDEIISYLNPYSQIIIRLKYNKIPFTKICRLIKKRAGNWGERKMADANGMIPVTPNYVSLMFAQSMSLLRNLEYQLRFKGELKGPFYDEHVQRIMHWHNNK